MHALAGASGLYWHIFICRSPNCSRQATTATRQLAARYAMLDKSARFLRSRSPNYRVSPSPVPVPPPNSRKPSSSNRSVRKRDETRSDERPPLTLKSTEQLLIDAAAEIDGASVLTISVGAAQAAAAVAYQHPQSQVECDYFDVFLADCARERWANLPNLTIRCQSDLSEGPVDDVLLTLPAGGNTELARELMQQAVLRMKPEGRLFASSDNPKDHWLHEQLKDQFGKVTNRGFKSGKLYIGTQPKPIKKLKEYDFWFAFRDREQLIHARSRPGVFNHRALDLGARALIESLTIPDGPQAGEVVHNGFNVLDLGCGSGAVGFAAAFRAANVRVHAIDANARAIECTRDGALKNGLAQHTTQLEAEGRCEQSGEFDLVLANPPYFSNFKIGEIFLFAAQRALRFGGRAHFVTKQPTWYTEQFSQVFDDVSVREIRGYFIIKGTKRKSDWA